MSRHGDVGDGDRCPVAESHGRMLVIANSNPLTQYCPQQDHDGVWSKGIKHLPTRAFWPYHHFEAAAEEYRLGNHPEQ